VSENNKQPYTMAEYQKDCLRTKSNLYHPELADRHIFNAVMNQAMSNGAMAGKIKKAVFGGKDLGLSCGSESLSFAPVIAGISPDMVHAILGIINEAGELAEMFLKTRYGQVPIDATNFIEEAGDSLWFWMLACHAAGVDPEEVMRRNIAKLRARFPDKFDPVLNDQRDLDAEKAALAATPEPIKPVRCWVCESENLQAKWMSDTNEGWVCCNKCGNVSTPRPLSEGREAIIAQWNKENPKP
jgi:NTP pyrophosphatase (non-canonical NTP hydrolase)